MLLYYSYIYITHATAYHSPLDHTHTKPTNAKRYQLPDLINISKAKQRNHAAKQLHDYIKALSIAPLPIQPTTLHNNAMLLEENTKARYSVLENQKPNK
jgi:hypothetical protein